MANKREIEMSENKITREEMIDWFGDDAPIEAINLVWNAPGDMTLGEIRTELRKMGEQHRAARERQSIDRETREYFDQKLREGKPGCYTKNGSVLDIH